MKLTGIILAGGKSSRMNEDKGLMLLNGKPMIQYVIDALSPFVDELIIVSNNEAYETFGHAVYKDLIKNKGPLAGIYTGLKHSKTTKNIVLSCDVPYVSPELLSFLIEESNNEITIPKKGTRTHQLIGVFSKLCTTSFKKSIEKNDLKLLDAFKNLNLNVVDANHFEEQLFTNINSPSDIKD